MAQKVVITGASGLIGSCLAQMLNAQGYEVHGISRGRRTDNASYLKDVQMHVADILDQEALENACAGTTFIFHLVHLGDQECIDDPQEGERINVGGTLAVLQAARATKCSKLIFASSASVYGDQPVVPYREDMPPTPIDPFGLYKHFGEELLRLWAKTYGVPSVSLRIFNAYGPQDRIAPDAFVMGRFLDLRRKGQPLTIDGDGMSTRDYVYVEDIARACILSAEHPTIKNGETFNIGSGTETSLNGLAAAVGGEVIHTVGRPGFRRGPVRRVADITRAKEELGWEPKTTLEEGIVRIKQMADIH